MRTAPSHGSAGIRIRASQIARTSVSTYLAARNPACPCTAETAALRALQWFSNSATLSAQQPAANREERGPDLPSRCDGRQAARWYEDGLPHAQTGLRLALGRHSAHCRSHASSAPPDSATAHESARTVDGRAPRTRAPSPSHERSSVRRAPAQAATPVNRATTCPGAGMAGHGETLVANLSMSVPRSPVTLCTLMLGRHTQKPAAAPENKAQSPGCSG